MEDHPSCSSKDLEALVHSLGAEVAELRAGQKRFLHRIFASALTVWLLSCAANEVGSESLTLTTYYPAPSGTYLSLVTTGGFCRYAPQHGPRPRRRQCRHRDHQSIGEAHLDRGRPGR